MGNRFPVVLVSLKWLNSLADKWGRNRVTPFKRITIKNQKELRWFSLQLGSGYAFSSLDTQNLMLVSL